MRPSERWWNRWRGMLLVTLCAMVYGLGFGPLALQATNELDHAGVIHACHDEVRARMPEGDVTRFVAEPRVRASGEQAQVLWSFDGRSGRTHFSCEAIREGATWRVTQLLAVNW